jgi:hypothetical protein
MAKNTEAGISAAAQAFRETRATGDPQVLIQSDYTYSEQEYQFCDPADIRAQSSLTASIRGFKDALNSLEIVKESEIYKKADKTHPTDPDHRVQGCPLDAFHQCCKAHITRLDNNLKTPGINMIEKAVIEQRQENMKAARTAYLKLQMAALEAVSP